MRSESGSFFGDCLAERRIDLCEGARVILLHNLDLEAEGDQKLCNGSLGVVLPMPSTEVPDFDRTHQPWALCASHAHQPWALCASYAH